MIKPAFRINFSKQVAEKGKPVKTDYVAPSTRLVAALADWGIVAVIAVIINAVISWMSPQFSKFTWFLPSLVIVGWIYFAIFESNELGATPVKKFLLLRVTDKRGGSHIGFLRASLRQLGKLLPFLAVMLTILWHNMHYRTLQPDDYRRLGIFIGAYLLIKLILLLRRDRRLLHDFLAGSVVLPIQKLVVVPRKSGPTLKYGD